MGSSLIFKNSRSCTEKNRASGYFHVNLSCALFAPGGKRRRQIGKEKLAPVCLKSLQTTGGCLETPGHRDEPKNCGWVLSR